MYFLYFELNYNEKTHDKIILLLNLNNFNYLHFFHEMFSLEYLNMHKSLLDYCKFLK